MSSSFAEIDWRGKRVRIEHAFIATERKAAPLVVFLHEGLGSLAMWRDFPKAFCDAAGVRGLVYSRPGYGRSTPRAPEEAWDLDFMHRQAHEVLPALLTALDIDATTTGPGCHRQRRGRYREPVRAAAGVDAGGDELE